MAEVEYIPEGDRLRIVFKPSPVDVEEWRLLAATDSALERCRAMEKEMWDDFWKARAAQIDREMLALAKIAEPPMRAHQDLLFGVIGPRGEFHGT